LWNDINNKSLTLSNDSILFSLEFEKIGNKLLQTISYNSSVTPVELYDSKLSPLALEFIGASIILNQSNQLVITTPKIYPNPSNGKIIIEYSVTENTNVDFVFTNSKGQILGNGSIPSKKGGNSNTIYLKQFGLKSNGIYYLHLLIEGKRKIFKLMCTDIL
jgi:hypothetical protein